MPPEGNTDARMREVLAMVAPGTPLRDGLERILRGRTGALVVLGLDRSVDALTRSGFTLDVDEALLDGVPDDVRQAARHAAPHLVDGRLIALRVLLQQDIDGDGLFVEEELGLV